MNNLNILIVEDESLVAMELKSTITDFGYNVVDFATNNSSAIKLMKNNDINLILMDINLRDTLNGIELYKELKTKVAIIYITAYKDDHTILEAIETNPLGYLIKPHNDDELKILLKLAYYKMHSKAFESKNHENIINFAEGYSFNIKDNKLFFHNVFIKLSIKELELLKLLIEARGSFVSYKKIEEEIWKDKVVHDSAMRTLIYRLRGKLEYKLIKNEFNYGVKLEF